MKSSTEKRYSPLNERYWKGIRLLLMMVGLWPARALGEPTGVAYSHYQRCFCFVDLLLVVAQMHYIWSHFNSTSFLEIGHMFMGLFGNMLVWVRLLISFDKKYGKCSHDFFDFIYLKIYQQRDEFSTNMANRIENISKYFSYYLFVVVTSGIVLFCASPAYTNYQNGAYSLENIRSPNITLLSSVYISFPLIDHDRDVAAWCLVYIISFCLTTCISICISTLDLYLFLMSFHVLGQISILKNHLESLPNPNHRSTETIEDEGMLFFVEQEMFDECENEQLLKNLVIFIQRHKKVTEFLYLLFNSFGNALIATYLFYMTSGCLLLLELTQGKTESYMRYGPMTAVLFSQLILTSVILENIRTTYEKLVDYLYLTPWQCMSISNQKVIQLLLLNYQKPMKLKAKGILEVGLRAMVGILKTSFSYFTFLRTQKH